MAIVSVPASLRNTGRVECAICHRVIPLSLATAGRLTCEGFQAFACNGHFWNGNEFITGWADFVSDQRLALLHQGIDPCWQAMSGHAGYGKHVRLYAGNQEQRSDEGGGDGWALR